MHVQILRSYKYIASGIVKDGNLILQRISLEQRLFQKKKKVSINTRYVKYLLAFTMISYSLG